jgi:aminoglycoside phosphotransferase (APT) family kinase protein
MEIERNIDNIELSYDQLLLLIRRAFPDCQKIDVWGILSGGAANTSYKFMVGNEAFVLRLYTRNRMHCKTEQELLRLIQSKVPVAELVYSDEKYEPWAYAIFRFVAGLHIDKVSSEFKTSLSSELGRVLALIHSFKFPHAGLFGEGLSIAQSFEPGSSPYFEEAYNILSKAGNARLRLGNKLADNILSFMQQNQEYFPRVGNNICLVHSDFKPVNLLYTPQGTICVLDWEFAHSGMGIMDFAILLRHRHQFSLDLDALKSGYESNGGVLPAEWFRSALITDFVNIIQLLNTPAERPKLFNELKIAIESTMNQNFNR